MKAFILAAGLGTRLAPLTTTTPKCLITVGAKSMLEHTVDKVKALGVTSIVINLHHHADQIKKFVASKNNFGLDLHFSEEAELLGTGGGIKKVSKFFTNEEHFLVHNSDVYSEIDLKALLMQHTSSQSIATLAVIQRESNRQLLFDQEFQLIGWENEDKKDLIAHPPAKSLKFGFTGIQVITPKLFEFMKGLGDSFSIISAYMQAARAQAKIKAFDIGSSYWIDMGTAKKLEELERKLGKK